MGQKQHSLSMEPKQPLHLLNQDTSRGQNGTIGQDHSVPRYSFLPSGYSSYTPPSSMWVVGNPRACVSAMAPLAASAYSFSTSFFGILTNAIMPFLLMWYYITHLRSPLIKPALFLIKRQNDLIKLSFGHMQFVENLLKHITSRNYYLSNFIRLCLKNPRIS